jgi:CRISPR-associated protein Cas1
VTTPWRVVDLLSFEGTVTAGRGQLRVGDDGTVALADVLAVLVGPKCSLHASVFERAAVFGVALLHCDWKGEPVSASFGWSSGYRVATRHRAQAELSLPRQKQGWQRIVQAKIRNQAEVLDHLARTGGARLADLARSVRSGDPTNTEAQAARIYWRSLFGHTTFRRLPGSRSGPNGALDYGYAVLRSLCLRSIAAAGLWPSLGIWHRSRDNPFALVDDLIEPFRPAVNLIVVREHPTSELDKETKVAIVAVVSARFDAAGHTVATCIEQFAQNLGAYVEGDAPRLDPPRFKLHDSGPG